MDVQYFVLKTHSSRTQLAKRVNEPKIVSSAQLRQKQTDLRKMKCLHSHDSSSVRLCADNDNAKMVMFSIYKVLHQCSQNTGKSNFHKIP